MQKVKEIFWARNFFGFCFGSSCERIKTRSSTLNFWQQKYWDRICRCYLSISLSPFYQAGFENLHHFLEGRALAIFLHHDEIGHGGLCILQYKKSPPLFPTQELRSSTSPSSTFPHINPRFPTTLSLRPALPRPLPTDSLLYVVIEPICTKNLPSWGGWSWSKKEKKKSEGVMMKLNLWMGSYPPFHLCIKDQLRPV